MRTRRQNFMRPSWSCQARYSPSLDIPLGLYDVCLQSILSAFCIAYFVVDETAMRHLYRWVDRGYTMISITCVNYKYYLIATSECLRSSAQFRTISLTYLCVKTQSTLLEQQKCYNTVMGAISYSDAIAIAQVVYYAPAILACGFLCARHGFTRSSGWILLVVFCLLRIIGASASLSTINNSGSTTALTIALICSVMGTSPLLLASLGLLLRM